MQGLRLHFISGTAVSWGNSNDSIYSQGEYNMERKRIIGAEAHWHINSYMVGLELQLVPHDAQVKDYLKKIKQKLQMAMI